MKLVFASDSFKGSLDSREISLLLQQAANEVFPHAKTVPLCIADGGEGSLQVLMQALNGTIRTMDAADPFGRMISAQYGVFGRASAVIEMAQASGLPLIADGQLNPEKASSRGTGMIIRHALEHGVNDIIIALGGSATNDGGMGAMAELGVKFIDAAGRELSGCGRDLSSVAKVDLTQLHPATRHATFTVMCDVSTPLLGENGATHTFARQKGADDAMVSRLEKGMQRYAAAVREAVGKDCSSYAGAGAAGGLGFALMSFLNAQVKSGIETVLNALNFNEIIQDADLVITGEGRADHQSAFGKVLSGVGSRCSQFGTPVIAIVGSLGPGYEQLYDCGINGIVTILDTPMSLQQAIENSRTLYLDAARRLFHIVDVAMSVRAGGKKNSE